MTEETGRAGRQIRDLPRDNQRQNKMVKDAAREAGMRASITITARYEKGPMKSKGRSMSEKIGRRSIGNPEMARILESFAKHLACWKVGLGYGSALYFDMGEVLMEQIKPGVMAPIGSANLTLEGYKWTISAHGSRIVDSRTITPETIDHQFQDMFRDKRLERLEFFKTKRELKAKFSTEIIIRSSALLSGEYIDDNLCLFLIPDGRVLGCDPRYGFFDDGSKSHMHEEHYAEA